MTNSTEDKIKGTFHEVKGTIKRKLEKLPTTPHWKTKGKLNMRGKGSTQDRRSEKSRRRIEEVVRRTKKRTATGHGFTILTV